LYFIKKINSANHFPVFSIMGMLFVFFVRNVVFAQDIQFQHINSSNDLSNNNVRCVVIDKSGLLWIGTSEGLHIYDGYKVSVFNNRSSPELSYSIVTALLCDSYNRIWFGITGGVGYLDSNRNVHRVMIDSGDNYIQSIMEATNHDIIIVSSKKIYRVSNSISSGNNITSAPVKWANEILGMYSSRIRDISWLSNDQYLFIIGDTLSIIDFKSNKKTFDIKIKDVCSGCRIDSNEILLPTYQGKFYILNIRNRSIKEIGGLLGKNINDMPLTNINRIRFISPGIFAIASFFSGFNILDLNKRSYSQYLHNPLDEHSISENRVVDIFCLEGGDIFLTTYNTGLNYFNLKQYHATHINAFSGKSNEIFDGYINDIQIDREKKIWLAAFDRIIIWDREKNSIKFLRYNKNMYNTGMKSLEVKSLCMDNDGKMWACIYEEGVVRIDEKSNHFQLITHVDTNNKMSAFKSSYVQDIRCDKEGYIWGGSGSGIFRINTKTLEVDSLLQHPVLRAFIGKKVNKIWIDSADRVWFATALHGAYCFDQAKQELKNYSVKEGLPSNICYSFAQDNSGNIYVGTLDGLGVLQKNGHIKVYNEQNGLRTGICLGLLADKNGNIWMPGLHNTMIRFDFRDSSFKFFSQESGLSAWGFRINSSYKSEDDEMFWGCNKGLTFFYPDQLAAVSQSLKLSIQKLILVDSTINFTQTETLTLPYKQNNVEFHFTAIDLFGSKNIFYQYMLTGYDAHWVNGTDITSVKYNFLPPGDYTFMVRASKDGISWIESINKLNMTILAPFWKTWWYISFVILLLILLLYIIIRWREKDIKAVEIEKTKVERLTAEQYKNQLELEQISNFFSTSFINKNNIDELLKEVAKNLISKLGFENCMIYLWNDDKTKLVQKAGYGPSGSLEEIEKLIFSVAPGEGIVGHVALTREPLIVSDTSTDARYRPEEMICLSEICVPVRYNDELIGVIDSEHKEKNFFTQTHLQIMATIATMIAGKIKSIESEQALQQRKNELEIVSRQLAQVQLAGLRNQMNPHFIFNSLNSINTFILKNDQDNASEYLNKFSQLMRMILDNSRNEWILLENELSALKLYIELEALRFENFFTYNIIVSPEVMSSSVLLPPLLIQPYVENAIWHGLMHRKEPGGKIRINVWKKAKDLVIEIEDNGIGRDASERLKSKTNRLHRSHGMKITAERLAIVNDVYKANAGVQVIDLADNSLNWGGTLVILTIEYKTYEGNIG
jgi:two-component system LytT family sensor kinase